MAHPSHLIDRPPSYDQEVDPEKKAKRGWQSALIGHPLLIAVILLHILLAILAAWFIVDRQVLAKRLKFTEVSVTVTGPSAAAAKQQTKVTEKRDAISVPDVVNNITIPETTSVNLPDVSLPEVTNNANDGKLNGTGLSGEGLAMGNGSGVGSGMMAAPDTAISAADIMPTPFGGTTGQGDGFEGKFFDLKQLRDRSNSGVGVGEYPGVVKDFMNKDWPANYFVKYYAGHQKLYLSQVLIPYMLAENGPKAFNVEKDVKPGCWVALYHAKVRVSQTITFRFCGFGDDVDEVAVNSKTVFDGSYRGTAISQTIAFPSAEEGKVTVPLSGDDLNPNGGGSSVELPFIYGNWVTFNPDTDYNVQILVGEHPGGRLCAWLMIQEKDKTYATTPAGFPLLPLFRVGSIRGKDSDVNCPPYDKNAVLPFSLAGSDDPFAN